MPATFAAGERLFTPEFKRIIAKAGRVARDHEHTWTGIQHLWLALLDPPLTATAAVLSAAGLDAHSLREETVALLATKAAQELTAREEILVQKPSPTTER